MTEEVQRPELRKDKGSRTFTMRELLNEFKNSEANEDKKEATSQYSLVLESCFWSQTV